MKYILDLDHRIMTKELGEMCVLPAYLRFSGTVEESSAKTFCEEFEKAVNHALKAEQEVLPIIIDSYGGDAYALLSMIDTVKASSDKIKIATIVEGKAMSAGAFFSFSVGAEGYRFVAPNATVMIHEVSSFQCGKLEELKVNTQETERLNELAFQIMAENCGKKKDYFLGLIHDKKHADWYLDANECLKHNLANHVGVPTFNVKVNIEHNFEMPTPPRPSASTTAGGDGNKEKSKTKKTK